MNNIRSSVGEAGDIGDNEADWPRLYRVLYRIRATEERIAEIYLSDRIKSPRHQFFYFSSYFRLNLLFNVQKYGNFAF